MPDRSQPPSHALHQIYAVAAARWRFWDARHARRDASSGAGREARRPSGGVPGRQRASAASRLPGQGRAGRSPRGRVTASERIQALRLRREGKTLREISQVLKRSISTISRMLRQAPSATGAGGASQRLQPVETTTQSRSRAGRPAARATGETRSRASGPPTLAEVRELHNRITRLESSLTALASAMQALALTRSLRGSGRRS